MGERADQILNRARECVRKLRLNDAISTLQPLYNGQPNLLGYDDYQLVVDNYQRMVEYMKKGFHDAEREKLYRQLLRRIYRITENLEISWRCKNQRIYVDAFRTVDHLNMSHAFIEDVLERFVSDVAMLSLEPDDSRQQRSDELYQRHATFIERLFNALFISLQWNTADEQFYTRLLLQPTIDLIDQQQLVSAISLACMNVFDIHKLNVLAAVYLHAEDEVLRQRALIGFMFSMTSHPLYAEEQQTIMKQVVYGESAESDEKAAIRELLDLQKQVFFCLNAEEDHRKIQQDIMPTLMKNNSFTITRYGIEEKEDDPMEDILHPDAADKAMEKMEESIQKMMQMQKDGSDIFFGGFRQMKRFPFFDALSNWFCPFYGKHPGLKTIYNKINGDVFIEKIKSNHVFCDSDLYSFAFGFASVIDNLPKDIREAFLTDPTSGFDTAQDDVFHKPAFIRRRYMQDLYRFFRVYHSRGDLMNPFGNDEGNSRHYPSFFFTLPVFDDPCFNAFKTNLGMFLYKQKRYDELNELLASYSDDSDNNYLYLRALSYMHNEQYEDAAAILEKQLSQGDDVRALRTYARASMLLNNYQQAADSYHKLQELIPAQKNYLLNEALALLQLGQKQEAVEKVYQADFQYPDDPSVQRILAWVLLNSGKIEQADTIYCRLLEEEPAYEDYVNAAYCKWIGGDISTTVNYFRKALHLVPDDKGFAFLAKEILKDSQLLIDNGIPSIDIRLMTELIE